MQGLTRPLGPTPPVLSRIGSPALGAWSVARKLRTAYAGSAIRVRRSNDNAETDIGFNADGTLNTTALAAHVGANSGFVTTIYDQIGSANLVQATTANQPRIVNAGTTDTIGTAPTARPAARHRPGTESHWLDATIAVSDATWSGAVVGSLATGAAAFGRLLSIGTIGVADTIGNGPAALMRNNAAQGLAWYPTDYTVQTIALAAYDAPFVASAVADGANIAPRCNGVMFASSPPPRTASFTLSNLRVGSFIQNGAAGQWSGSFAEIVMFPDALPVVDRLALERDMGQFYGVVVQ